MKVVKLPAVPSYQPAARVNGAVIVDGNHVFMEAGMGTTTNLLVNLTTGIVSNARPYRDPQDVAYPNAELLLEGVKPVPVPPVKSGLQQAQEFVTWYYNNPTASGASALTTYTPQEVLNLATNANVRRQWTTWLAARDA